MNDFLKNAGYRVAKNYRAYNTTERFMEMHLLEPKDIISMRPPVHVGKRMKYFPVKITDEAYDRLLHYLDTKALTESESGVLPPTESESGVLPPNPTYTECVEDSKNAVKPIQTEYDKLVAFAKCIRASEGCINVGMMAKILTKNGVQMSESKLFDYLRTNGFLEEVGNIRNVPTDSALTSGYFDFTEVLIDVNGKRPIISFTPKITGLGQLFILDKFGCTTDDWLPY